MPTLECEAWRLRVRGRVQGVGFRPFVCRLAREMNLSGWVCNDETGVLIHIEGIHSARQAFCASLERRQPSGAQVESIALEVSKGEGGVGFDIRPAPTTRGVPLQARVPADRAICGECQREIMSFGERRFHHPFATCTECGPRFSILFRMPYERPHTAMQDFVKCRACAAEYENLVDRRFHAEPIACLECGPLLTFSELATGRACNNWHAIVAAADLLYAGKILALKGLGGYQLLVRADDNTAVERLRQRKHRPTKPFAVMVRCIEDAVRLAHVSSSERAMLQSPENPIVLLTMKSWLCYAVAPRLPLVGLFLPSTPLHVLLLSLVDFPVIATSGNQSEEPIVIDEKRRDSLSSIADAFLDHDRPIARHVDDSVVRVIGDEPMTIRLARGYAPFALTALEHWAAVSDVPIPPMLAVGGQQKTTIALWTGKQAVLSAHLGDMDHPDSRRIFADTVDDLARLYGCEPRIMVGDLHPDYFTTRWAQAARKPFLQVQHHHAHAVACMVEHGLLDREVAAVIWDGTGFGTDGTIWGGEILRASMCDFQRIGALESFSLPGGEAAIHHPSRIALSLLSAAYGPTSIPDWLFEDIGISTTEARGLIQMIERQVNTPRTSSVGRLFDAASALILGIREVSYEGEAAIRLESAVYPHEDSALELESRIDADGVRRGDWRLLIRTLVEDLENGIANANCAARFHNALAQWAAACLAEIPLADVVLGGGCFQNAWLTTRTRAAIVGQGKSVHVPSSIPPNDGGLAVGQLAIGMARWQRLGKEQ